MSALTSYVARQFGGAGDPAKEAAWGTRAATERTGGAPNEPLAERVGFFTDTSICIGCKACEVACKEWNRNPEDGYGLTGHSYDNTGELGSDTWRHVAFVEQSGERIAAARKSGRKLVDLGMPSVRRAESTETPSGAVGVQPETSLDVDVFALASSPEGLTPTAGSDVPDFRWLMSSDVCKHCTHAGCLDNCPTGAIFRSEFGTVVIQADVCNGCGYCVGGCPFGVVERREKDAVINHGNAQKCTLCYDRLTEGQTPACAQTCPTTSIKFGPLSEMTRLAEERVAELHARGMTEARLYGAGSDDGVGGTGSVFLLLDDPEVYGLPPDPVAPSRHLASSYKRMLAAAGGMAAAAAIAFVGGGV